MRCAIYTRVSTDEQALSEYSSLKRQEEICRNYIDIHTEKGWKVAGVYEDAGYSGKDFERPGIQELMADVRAGKLDAIVTYKIDRISRSLKDFYDLWEVLKAHNVTFVSATQHFDTSDSMGMLILNILLSFAQFERELARERTMSKMAGRAEKGLWNGGHTPLGYDYVKDTQTLRPNPQEVPLIRFVYRRVIETRSTCAAANEANARGYRTRVRVRTRRDGSQQAVGGQRFDEDMVAAIIRNPVYKGFVRYGGMLYPGKHEAIVDEETWEEANKAIGNGREDDTGLYYADPHIHLLKGILRCGACGRAMTPYRSGKKTKDGTPYLYYACVDYTKDGSLSTCPIKMLPAREFEALIPPGPRRPGGPAGHPPGTRGRCQPRGGGIGGRTGGECCPSPRGAWAPDGGHPAADRGHEAAGPPGRRHQGGVSAAGAREGIAPDSVREAGARHRVAAQAGPGRRPDQARPAGLRASGQPAASGGPEGALPVAATRGGGLALRA